MQDSFKETYDKLQKLKDERKPATMKEDELKKAEAVKKNSKDRQRRTKNSEFGAAPSELRNQTITDFSTYSVLQFKIHKFDTTGKLKAA